VDFQIVEEEEVAGVEVDMFLLVKKQLWKNQNQSQKQNQTTLTFLDADVVMYTSK
jgi:hypothetical protein